MFTGIIAETGKIKKIKPIKGGLELQISCSFAPATHVDESISVNGVCLTVVGRQDDFFTVQCVEETLRKTSFSEIAEGNVVNLERSLTLEKAIEGHIVQGHVDTVGRIEEIEIQGNDRLITVSYPDEFLPFIVARGSVAIDGISLTVARESENRLTVAIIPYTWNFTNLKHLNKADSVNIEFDIFGKYVVRYMETMKGI